MISVQANTPYNSQHPETWEGPLVLEPVREHIQSNQAFVMQG